MTNAAETMGLLALMLLHESRRKLRQAADGDIVLLEDKDRSRCRANERANEWSRIFS
ncbi:DUF6596 domain-containing protein [Planctomycetaceae bacterium SH139]